MSLQPTSEQAAIIAAARSTPDNLLIQALAGAAKTSTLVMIAEALPTTATLALAFNKKIAVAMEERLPSTCHSMTLNGLGHRTWAKFLGRSPRVNTAKNHAILKRLIDDLPSRDRSSAYDLMSDTLKAIEEGKSKGYVPTGRFPDAKRLLDDDAFFEGLEDEPTPLQERLIREATTESLSLGLKGEIDFSDQILLPALYPVTFLQYPLVMVDEAQDLSALNHVTLAKLAKKRLIACGDACQAIYAFRGAHEGSMGELESRFAMRPLVLSVSFRCPQAVVTEARWRAPHMQWPEWAKPGSVERWGEWTADQLPDHSAVLCRNNAPLFTLAIKLLKNGRYPQLVGNDIGKYLIKVMKKFGPLHLSQDEARAALTAWLAVKLTKTRNESKAHDQADCIRVFLDQGETLGAAITYAEHVLSVQGPISLMTGHKAKGLEWDNIFILDQHLIRDEGQDPNLRYVMQTRAKDRLVYINTEDFRDNQD